MTTSGREKITRHVRHAVQYFENARQALGKGEAGKSGELLWGAVAECIHALAAYRNIRLRGHGEIRQFILRLARELGDADLLKGFQIAEGLHFNYYEVAYETPFVASMEQTVRETMDKLLRLIPPAAVGLGVGEGPEQQSGF